MSNGTDSSVTSLRLPIYAIKNVSALAAVVHKRRLHLHAIHCRPVNPPALGSCSVCGASFTEARDHRSVTRAQAAMCHVCRRHAPAAERERGLVLGFNRRRRFGFLRASDGRRVFCRGAEVVQGRRLRKGDVVAFRRVAGRRGPEAQDVSVEASAADLKAWTARLVASVAPERGATDESDGMRGSRNKADSL